MNSDRFLSFFGTSLLSFAAWLPVSTAQAAEAPAFTATSNINLVTRVRHFHAQNLRRLQMNQ
ncbi:MAG: hypothetical protein V4532_12360, partial [Pseudomonadota bacterium]